MRGHGDRCDHHSEFATSSHQVICVALRRYYRRWFEKSALGAATTTSSCRKSLTLAAPARRPWCHRSLPRPSSSRVSSKLRIANTQQEVQREFIHGERQREFIHCEVQREFIHQEVQREFVQVHSTPAKWQVRAAIVAMPEEQMTAVDSRQPEAESSRQSMPIPLGRTSALQKKTGQAETGKN